MILWVIVEPPVAGTLHWHLAVLSHLLLSQAHEVVNRRSQLFRVLASRLDLLQHLEHVGKVFEAQGAGAFDVQPIEQLAQLLLVQVGAHQGVVEKAKLLLVDVPGTINVDTVEVLADIVQLGVGQEVIIRFSTAR